MGKYYRHILFFTFIVAALLIALIQFNANRSTDELINSNENVLEELTSKNDIQKFQNALLTYETKTKGAILNNNNGDSAMMHADAERIRQQLQKLDSLKDDRTLMPALNELTTLVNQKIKYNTDIIQKLHSEGRDSAEALLNSPYNRGLNLRLKEITNNIDSTQGHAISNAIKDADQNGVDAKGFGLAMAILATLISTFVFGYVIYKIKEQQTLIRKLNVAEQQALEAARIKESFLTNMSHEIRTPLNAIIGFTNLLLHKDLDAESREYLGAIKISNENLSGIINNILDFSKLEAGMMPVETISFDMLKLLRDTAQLFTQKVTDKGLSLAVNISPNVPQYIISDPLKFTQILSNLLSNAIKFTTTGTITLDVNCIMMNGGLWLLADVTDTGIGIAPEHQSVIFNRFQQAESATTRKYGGTGLGLPIVQELVTLLNGKIRLESSPAGTKISLEIPVKAGETAAPDPTAIYFEEVKLHGHILIVEDQPLNQKLLCHLLKRWELDYKVAATGQEAINLLKTHRFDIILMDIQIPDMDGYAITAAIRKDLYIDTPVIALTAHALATEKSKCIEAGMNDYLAKPVRENQLRSLLLSYLNKQNGSVAFDTIDTGYLQSLSMGDTEYERIITEDFISQSQHEISELGAAIHNNQHTVIAQYAHRLRSTVGIMGLSEKTERYLDQLEYQNRDPAVLTASYHQLATILQTARTEAASYILSLNNK